MTGPLTQCSGLAVSTPESEASGFVEAVVIALSCALRRSVCRTAWTCSGSSVAWYMFREHAGALLYKSRMQVVDSAAAGVVVLVDTMTIERVGIVDGEQATVVKSAMVRLLAVLTSALMSILPSQP